MSENSLDARAKIGNGCLLIFGLWPYTSAYFFFDFSHFFWGKVCFIRHMLEEGEHSQEAKELVRAIITRLE